MGPIISSVFLLQVFPALHSSLLGPFVSYKENEVLWIQPQVTVFTTLYFLLNLEWAQKARVLVHSKPFQSSVMLYSNLLSLFLSCKKLSVVNITLGPKSEQFQD